MGGPSRGVPSGSGWVTKCAVRSPARAGLETGVQAGRAVWPQRRPSDARANLLDAVSEASGNRVLGSGRMLGRGVTGLLALALAGMLEASTVRFLPLDQMAVRADQIFTGEVVGVASQLNARRDGIFTFVTIEVDEYLKGGRRAVLTLRFLGGEAEGYRLTVPGSPEFHLGEEVLVFTDGAAGRIPTVLGMAAGKFRLGRDPSTGERLLERSLRGLNLEDSSGTRVTPGQLGSQEPASLDAVRRIVREALAAQ